LFKKLSLVAVFLIIELIAIIILQNNTKYQKKQILSNENHLIKTQYNTINNSFKVLANTVFEGYINQQTIIEDFAARDRDSLYVDLKPTYRYLKSLNFEQIHFHLPNNISFLRMHKPEKFGDDLTNIRYSVKYVNENKKFISGLEMGRAAPGFRFVYPLFDSNKHIGSVETSFSVYAFANQMEKTYKVHTHFLITKKLLDQKIFIEDKVKYAQSIELADHMMLKRETKVQKNEEERYLKKLFENELKNKLANRISTKNIFSLEIELAKNENEQHVHKIVTFLPLYNIEKIHMGYFVVYRVSKELKDLEATLFRNYFISALIILLIFILIYKELNSKDILEKKVQEKTQEIQDMATSIKEINISLEVRVKEEIEKNAKQERKIANQAKQAALGEMIGNIAHQWRQPLSAITTAATGMQLSQEMGILEDEDFTKFADGIVKNATYLSNTINDFRDFISSKKKFESFDVSKSVQKSLAVVNSSINKHKLKIITNFKSGIIISNYSNELQQAIINIFNNSKDVLKEKIEIEEDRIIFIDIYDDDKLVYIKMKDTAGGIPKEIAGKIFEPYFTTKHQSQGTGLGLYITHKIVCDSMDGKIDFDNVQFEHNGKVFTGAQFVLTFKKDKKEEKQ